MNFPTNPLNNASFTASSGTKYKYSLAKKAWDKVKHDNIVPEIKDTDTKIEKIWTGSLAQYNSIATKDDTILYFIKD